MGYSNPEYQARYLMPAGFNVTSTSTATASAQVVTNTAVAPLPKFIRRTKITGIRVSVVTAPNAGATTTKLVFLNGTSTLGVATIGTNTAGSEVDAVITAANAIVAADGEPTLNVMSTATASQSVTQGNYNIYLECQEQYA